jgi:hypothetical protein
VDVCYTSFTMKLYFEKWVTETIWTGKLTSIDTEILRERFDNLKELSDEEIIEELQNNEWEYDLHNILEEIDALQAQNSSAEKSLDYRIDIHTDESIMDKLEWAGWYRGCREFPRSDKLEYEKEKFINMIPEVKGFDMI